MVQKTAGWMFVLAAIIGACIAHPNHSGSHSDHSSRNFQGAQRQSFSSSTGFDTGSSFGRRSRLSGSTQGSSRGGRGQGFFGGSQQGSFGQRAGFGVDSTGQGSSFSGFRGRGFGNLGGQGSGGSTSFGSRFRGNRPPPHGGPPPPGGPGSFGNSGGFQELLSRHGGSSRFGGSNQGFGQGVDSGVRPQYPYPEGGLSRFGGGQGVETLFPEILQNARSG